MGVTAEDFVPLSRRPVPAVRRRRAAPRSPLPLPLGLSLGPPPSSPTSFFSTTTTSSSLRGRRRPPLRSLPTGVRGGLLLPSHTRGRAVARGRRVQRSALHARARPCRRQGLRPRLSAGTFSARLKTFAHGTQDYPGSKSWFCPWALSSATNIFPDLEPSPLFSTSASKMPQVMVVARNFMDMVASLPAGKLDMLYDSAFICEAVLRSLPPLAKKYALQMLYVLAPVTAAAMEEWVLNEYAAKHKVAIDKLLQLRVFVEVRDRRRDVSYKMNQKFQGNMQKYLVDGGSLPRESLPLSVTGRLPTPADLEAYALDQWECFLLQLINSSQVEKGTTFSSSMMKTFQRGLLSSRDGEASKLTENGFQFLLMETNAQLWYIMREYISSAEERGVDPTELISFLLELSFHKLGAAYSLNTLTDVQRIAIRDLAELGLVKQQQGRKDSWFIPTQLATNLSASLSDSSSNKEGFVVVETNFRMYAYSTSKLHCEILRLFSRVEYQLPNLIVGSVNKESIYGAFENGITAEQIISFLRQNAHPRVADKIPAVPENVTDQIRLWETDRDRVEMIPSHLYEDFPSKEWFEQCCDYARDNGYLLWEDSKRMRLIVRGEFHPEMREFLRRQR